MEYRYIVTILGGILLLQCLVFCFIRTLKWQLALKKATYRLVAGVCYLGVNSVLLIPFFTPYNVFRIVAFILVLLWFAFLLSAVVFVLLKISHKKWERPLRNIYPFAYLGLIGFSIFNAYIPKVERFSIQLDKPLSKPIKIGVASDTHLGILFGAKQLDRLAALFEQEKVDLILLPGDVMDDNTRAFEAENMLPHLAKLHAPLGVYATLGNHDFFGHQQDIYHTIEKAGIKVLWDQAIDVDGKFTLIGRNDDLYKARPRTEEILQDVDTTLPIFLIDHRPSDIEAHSRLPIDLQVSGHTHNGQIFPLNFVVKMLNRLSYGYEQIGMGHYFVTSGYGFWGVPMRLGSRSEILIIEVKGR